MGKLNEMLEEPLMIGLERDERFLEGILRSSEGDPELNVVGIETKPGIKKGENYMSLVSRIVIRARNRHKQSMKKAVLIKRQPANLTRRETFRCDPAFRNEAAAYKTVLPSFRKFTGESLPFPACFHASSQLLILEDLSPLGYVMADRQQGLDLKHSKLALKCLGRFHGMSLAMKASKPKEFERIKEEIKELIFLPEASSTFGVSMEVSLNTALSVLKAEENPEPLEEAIHYLQLLRGNVFQKMAAQVKPKEPLSVICHGDYWVNNLLFKYNEKGDPEDIIIVDLQVARYACPATDILQFLYTSTEPGLTEDHFEELLESYSEGLESSAGEELTPSLTELIEQIEERALYGFLIAALLLPVVTADKVIVDLDTLDETSLGSKEFSHHMQDNVAPGYRTRIRRIALEFMERGFL